MSSNEPNDRGFAGDPTTPQPDPDGLLAQSGPARLAEDIAIPDGDVTGALADGTADATSTDTPDAADPGR